jgi:hypothetical protein
MKLSSTFYEHRWKWLIVVPLFVRTASFLPVVVQAKLIFFQKETFLIKKMKKIESPYQKNFLSLHHNHVIYLN